MTDLRSSRAARTTASDDVQQLRNRIEELEKQLEPPQVAAQGEIRASSGDRLKVVTAALAGVSLLMAFPAFVTVRRWYRWWEF
jgi:hypothetical protein